MMMTSVGAKIEISLDENLLCLKESLRDYGFKVRTFKPGTLDTELFKDLSQTLLLTKNVEDFKIDAVVYNFDLIDIKQIKFIDTEKTRKNETAHKIANAIRKSGIGPKKGFFHLIIKDSGKWTLKQLL